MQAEDRIIHFSTELMHPPKQRDADALRKLYYDLSRTRSCGYDSSDFSQPGQVRFYSKRGQRTQSLAVFLPDRIALVEEWADIALSDYLEKVREVGSQAMAALEIPLFAAQTATLRSTFALTYFDDARVFLLDHVCGQEGQITPFFGRPIGTGGLRFVLPQTPDHPGTLHVVIESFRHNPKEVFVEVRGVFGSLHITPDQLETAVTNLKLVRRFIREHIFPFVDQYDTSTEGAR